MMMMLSLQFAPHMLLSPSRSRPEGLVVRRRIGGWAPRLMSVVYQHCPSSQVTSTSIRAVDQVCSPSSGQSYVPAARAGEEETSACV